MSVAFEAVPTAPQGRVMTTAGWILTGLFAAFMAFDITIKLIRLPIVEETGSRLHLPPASGFAIGLGELAIVVLYLLPRTSLLGAVLVAALMGGTAGVHLVNGNPLFSHILFGPYLAAFAWGGLWLRDARLRTLVPIRR